MSWSVTALGKVEAVKTEVIRQFSQGVCVEPEEGIRQTARQLILTALDGQVAGSVVEVSASGSCLFKNWSTKEAPSNSVSISIQPKYSFCE